MCLAIPGKLTAWLERAPPFSLAQVEFGGIRRNVNLACVPEAEVGDFVLVHAGVAICRIDASEAERLWTTLAEAEVAREFTAE
jgi:hydrogenase expression/formation protein HypC